MAGENTSRGWTRLADSVPTETVSEWTSWRRALRHRIRKCSLRAHRTAAGTNPAAARAEFQRILKPGGWVVLIWNERLVTPGFMAGHEELQNKFAREKPHPAEAEFNAFYGHAAWRLARIPNRQSLDGEGLRGRIESSSWSPLPGADGYEAMMLEMLRLFRKYERDGRVTIEYETHIYYGRL